MKKPITEDELDKAIAKSAEEEAVVQLAIIRALGPLKSAERQRVVQAVVHLLEADSRVAGVLDAFLRGSSARRQNRSNRKNRLD
jgi:hypothetical protein